MKANSTVESCLPSPAATSLRLLAWTLILIGLFSRMAPLLNFNGRMAQQWPVEDGYLMQTVARNIGIGNGMSTADGTMPTNGVQPLATFIFVGCHWLAGGDKARGLLAAQVVELGLSVACAWMIYVLGRGWLSRTWWHGLPARDSDQPAASGNRHLMAALGAAGWFASPILTKHSMNCLETSLYIFMIAASLHFYGRWIGQTSSSAWVGRAVAMGVVLGITFWARNDAVIFIFALCVVTIVLGLFGSHGRVIFARPAWAKVGHASSLSGTEDKLEACPTGITRWDALRRRFGQTMVMGATSVLIALPWLIFNKVRFGSIMPLSGHAEWDRSDKIAELLHQLPLIVSEYAGLVFQKSALWVPATAAIVAAGIFLLFVVYVAALIWRQGDERTRPAIMAAGVFIVLLSAFYSTMFLVPHFQSRYLAPISAPLAVIWGFIVANAVQRIATSRLAGSTVFVVGLIALLPAAFHVRLYLQGDQHMHFQVVEYVQKNIPDATWVGAIQSGTLGYYHDRTINLDGKVNPAAYANRGETELPRYILTTPIQYIADWDVAWWENQPGYKGHFKAIVAEKDRKLSVLQRVDEVTETRDEHTAGDERPAQARCAAADRAALC